MMTKLKRILHIEGIKQKVFLFLINKVFVGTNVKYFDIKRKLLNSIGYVIGEGTKVVGPIECTGKLIVGKNCWIGKNLKINGNGSVYIGNNCDIGPEVTFQTGGHMIGSEERRAGKGCIFTQKIGDGTWIGGRSTFLNDTVIGKGCVIAGGACVVKDVENNTLVGGVPAVKIKRL